MPVSISGSSGITGAINVQSTGSVLTGITTVTSELNVVGVVSATSFRGDGSQLTSVSGFNELDAALFN